MHRLDQVGQTNNCDDMKNTYSSLPNKRGGTNSRGGWKNCKKLIDGGGSK